MALARLRAGLNRAVQMFEDEKIDNATAITFLKELTGVESENNGVPSAYNLYVRERLNVLKNKGIPNKERMRDISSKWKGLPNSERTIYLDKHAQLINEKNENMKSLQNTLTHKNLVRIVQPRKKQTTVRVRENKSPKYVKSPKQKTNEDLKKENAIPSDASTANDIEKNQKPLSKKITKEEKERKRQPKIKKREQRERREKKIMENRSSSSYETDKSSTTNTSKATTSKASVVSTSNVSTNASSNATSNGASNTTSNSNPMVTSNVKPNAGSNGASNAASNVISQPSTSCTSSQPSTSTSVSKPTTSTQKPVEIKLTKNTHKYPKPDSDIDDIEYDPRYHDDDDNYVPPHMLSRNQPVDPNNPGRPVFVKTWRLSDSDTEDEEEVNRRIDENIAYFWSNYKESPASSYEVPCERNYTDTDDE